MYVRSRPIRLSMTALSVALAVVTGCTAVPTTKPHGPSGNKGGTLASPSNVPSPTTVALGSLGPVRTIAQMGDAVQLTGKVKLLSDKGSGILSNNSGGLISDHGGGLVSNNSGSLVSNNSGSLAGKNKLRLLADAAPTEALLADALIEVRDAQGRLLVDEKGQPLGATTDAEGHYELKAVLPAENLVLGVTLSPEIAGDGGKLLAMLPRAGGASAVSEQVIDTASSLGAAYVLDKYVSQSQTTFDKLPKSESDKLHEALDAARGLLAGTPSYRPEDLVAQTEDLRAKAPAVGDQLDTIKALLLGQEDLGEGLDATKVAVSDPRVAIKDAEGNIYFAESLLGRIRIITPDGKIKNFADGAHGLVRANFTELTDMAFAPGGGLFVVSAAQRKVYRIAADGKLTTIAGTGALQRGPIEKTAVETALVPESIALVPDGTLLIGENDTSDEVPRILSLSPEGELTALPAGDASWVDASVNSLVRRPDGTLLALIYKDGGSEIWRLPSGGTAWEKWVTLPQTAKEGGMALGPDGMLYVSEDQGGRVVSYTPTGTRTVVAGNGAALAARGLSRPAGLSVTAEGTLLIADAGNSRVFSLGHDGVLTVLAGISGETQSGDGGSISINSPGGVAFDTQGRLLVVEGSSHTVKRYDGTSLETVVGTTRGFGGDGGPAKSAQLDTPTGIVAVGDVLYVIDVGNNCLRRVGADGIITSISGPEKYWEPMPAKTSVDPLKHGFRTSMAVVAAPDGTLYWNSANHHQIYRLGTDGLLRMIAGAVVTGPELNPKAVPPGDAGDDGPSEDAVLNTPLGMALGPDGSLYFVDAGNLRIRRIADPGSDHPTISTFAGMSFDATIAGLASPPTTGSDAKALPLAMPAAICFDAAGNLYVTEGGTVALPIFAGTFFGVSRITAAGLPPVSSRIRKIAPDGSFSTIAGPGGRFFTDPEAGDALQVPTGIALDPKGRLVISDSGTNQLRFLPAGSF